jgi:type VI secretion system secreted protein VgrG
MPSPKSGSPGTIVPPTDPVEAHDADDAIPGDVEAAKASQREAGTGKYGSTPVTPHQNVPDADNPDKKSWIEVQLIDDVDEPVPGARYTVTLADGTVYGSTTDQNGVGRVSFIDPGQCDICFPDLDQDAWEPA